MDQSHVTTDGQPVSLLGIELHSEADDGLLVFVKAVTGLSVCDFLSDEMMGVSFTKSHVNYIYNFTCVHYTHFIPCQTE